MTGGTGGKSGDGGAGAYFAGSGATFNNTGAVAGGDGGGGGFSIFAAPGGVGGAGAYFAGNGATFTNTGVVAGGGGGDGGGTPIFSGLGGVGGAGAYFAGNGATFANSGRVTGGVGGVGPAGGDGGAGVYFAGNGATFNNTGSVTGGGGGVGFDCCFPVNIPGTGGEGGAGVSFVGGGATFNNTGVVTGGQAGAGRFFGSTGGVGGAGVYFAGSGATFANSGRITGGSGGVGGEEDFFDGPGGVGGAGVSFSATGATFTNSGTVTGGAGGGKASFVGFSGPGSGGPGVVGAGLTIINGGVIWGGVSGDGVKRADAIEFTGGANVLELRAGSTIVGNVVGTGRDLLRLGGAVNSAFDASALGAQYRDFGSAEKSGASAWTITGSTNASSPWTIDQGVLIVNGSIANASLTTVSGGATLAGVGAVGNLLVASGAVFAPGTVGAPGTMTVAGNLAFQPASTYSVEIAAAGYSRANVLGAASLNGNLVATFLPGAAVTRSYDVLHADGGLAGTRFAAFNDPPNFLESLAYGVNDVFVDLTAALGAGAALPGNQQSVANALNGYFNAGGLLPGNFSQLYGLAGSALSNVLASASGEAATGAQESAFQSINLFLEAMLDPFAVGRGAFAPAFGPGSDLPTHKDALPAFEPRLTSWAAAFGGDGRIDGDPAGSGSHDLSANASGVAAGLDYHLTRDMVIGAALGGGRTSWALSQGFGGGAGDLFDLGVYASRQFGAAYVSGALAFANQWLTTSRSGPFGEALSGRFASQTYGGRIEGGYRLATPAGGLTPYAALQAMDFDAHSYSEQDCCSGGFGLAYAGRTASDIRSEFGARFDHVVALQPEASLILRARAAWIHDWASDPRLGATFETLPGAGFNVVGAIPAKNVALLSGVAEMRLTGGATAGARFDGEFASGAHAYAGTVFVKLSF